MRLLGLADLELLEQLFEQLPHCPFFVKDRELRYVAANSAMARLCGLRRPSELYGKKAQSFFPDGLARRYEALDRQLLANGRAITNKLELSGAGVESAWLLYSRVPVKDWGGEIVGVAGSSRRLGRPDGADPTYRRLAKIAERLREQSDRTLRLDELADMAGISKSQLERDFLRLFALTPRAFLQHARLERALRLLETEMSIAAIAYECGYADHSAFTRRFRESIGTSPLQYRRRLGASRRKSGRAD